VYVGRIDENKGCKELFEFFDAYVSEGTGQLSLVLVGNSLLPIPKHPRIRHLGYLSDPDKFDAMAAADLLVMPSYFESLSMVALEAWALGRPVLANAKCDVLKAQCIRSNAGLYYDNASEFVETLRAIEQNRWLSATLGRNGRAFFREHYDWSVIERKYLDMLTRLSKETAESRMDPLPGWFDRRRQVCVPGAEVVAALPTGPVFVQDMAVAARSGVTAAPAEPPPEDRDRRPRVEHRGRYQRGRPRGGSRMGGA
jgi:hypothetical protein